MPIYRKVFLEMLLTAFPELRSKNAGDFSNGFCAEVIKAIAFSRISRDIRTRRIIGESGISVGFYASRFLDWNEGLIDVPITLPPSRSATFTGRLLLSTLHSSNLMEKLN